MANNGNDQQLIPTTPPGNPPGGPGTREILAVLKKAGSEGLRVRDLHAKLPHLDRGGISGQLTQLWKHYCVDRQMEPNDTGRSMLRYFHRQEKGPKRGEASRLMASSSRAKGAKRKKTKVTKATKRPTGFAGLLDALSDYIAEDRAFRERTQEARDLLLQAAALLKLPDEGHLDITALLMEDEGEGEDENKDH